MDQVEIWLERVGLYGSLFTAEELAQKVAKAKGWKVEIVPLQNMEPLGAAVLVGNRLRVFYRPDVKGFHRDYVIFHELGHVMLGHLDGKVGLSFSGSQEREAERVAKKLMKLSTGGPKYNKGLQKSYRRLFE